MSKGFIVRLLRIAEGFSQAALAEKLGVSVSYLCQVERERRTPGLPFLRDVAKVFHIPLALLVLDESDPDSALFADLQGILSRILLTHIETSRPVKKALRPAPKRREASLTRSRSARPVSTDSLSALPAKTC
ncbi:MAG: helix-turn-helix transcriptional regulator [Planctomycetes bacterium]|nr:helix-turn-helix transcriptional regulator [Planctomycetota bacterium]